MVIHQFNRLIRNKWFWGAFALAISSAFALDFLIADIRRGGSEKSGEEFAGEGLDRNLFESLRTEASFASGGNATYEQTTNYAWRMMAVLKTAEDNGIVAPDAEVRAALASQGITPENYKTFLAQSGWGSDKLFEQFVRHQILKTAVEGIAAASVSPSPDAVERRIQDWGSDLAVLQVTFTNAFKDAKADFPAFYNAHKEELALPERRKVRYAFIPSGTPERLEAAAKLVTQADAETFYAERKDDLYTDPSSSPTQKVYKAFEDVRADITARLAAEEAVRTLKRSLDAETQQLYGVPPQAGTDTWLDTVAKREGADPAFSKWIAASALKGYTADRSELLRDFPGIDGNFTGTVMELPADAKECEGVPYCAVFAGTNGVYVMEAAWIVHPEARTTSHIPECDEAAAIEALAKRADDAAAADKFKEFIDERVKTLPADLAALPADNTNRSAIAGATLAPLRRFSFAETRRNARQRYEEIAAQEAQAASTITDRNQLQNQLGWLDYMRRQIENDLSRDVSIAAIEKGALSEPEWLGTGTVRFTFMVERERNGANEADADLRASARESARRELAAVAVENWYQSTLAAFRKDQTEETADESDAE